MMIRALLISAFLSLTANGQVSSVLNSELPVGKVEGQGFNASEVALIQRTLGISSGQRLSPVRINEGIRTLHAKGVIETLFVEAYLDGKSLKVVLRGQRLHKIKKVRFTDIENDVLDEVKSRISVDEEDQYGSQALNTIREKIRQAYEARGYYRSEVKINYVPVAGSDQYEAEVVIRKHEPTIVDKISVFGGNKEENTAMKEVVTLKKGMPFRRKDLEESIDKVNRFLQTNQYPTSKVENTSFKFSPDRATVEVGILVRVNERFQFQFSGNTVFDEVELRDLLTEEVLLQSDSSARIAATIETKYKAIGYHFCEVKIQVVEKDKLNTIRFAIHEGDKVRIDAVDFSGGMGEFSRDELVKLFFEDAPGVLKRRVFWEEGIHEAVRQLRRKLDELGYLSGTISPPRVIFSSDKKGAELFFDLEVGARTIVSGIELKGVNHFSRAQIEEVLGLHPGEYFSRERLAEGKKRLLTRYQNDGFADAKYVGEGKDSDVSISRDYRQALVTIHVVEGTQYRVGEITVEGNRKTQPHVIIREVRLKSGDLYDPHQVRASEETVSSLGLFSRVEIVPITDPKAPQTKNLKVVVTENRPGIGEFGVGAFFEDPRLRLRGFGSMTYRNLWGLNQTATARAEVGLPFSLKNRLVPFIEYYGTLGYRSPYPLGVPAVFGAQFIFDNFEVSNVDNRITIQATTKIELRIEKKLTRQISTVYKLYQLERTSREVLDNPGTVTINLIGSTGPGVIFDLRDDIYNPTKGSYHTINLELASPLLLSNDDIAFYMLLSRNSFYVPLPWNMSLSFFAGVGYAQSLFEGKTIPSARLGNELSLGGSRSIRGFSLRRFSPVNSDLAAFPVEQTAFYNGRAELSIPVFSQVSGALFFDTGEIFPNLRGSGRHDGIGIGLRYKTPVGPVVVDLAQGLGQDREDIKFYFTVGSL